MDTLNKELSHYKEERDKIIMIVGAISILIFFSTILIFPFNIFLAFLPVLYAVFKITKIQKAYATEVKERVCTGYFKENFENVYFNIDGGFDERELKDAAVIPTGNRYFTNDFIRGRFEGVNFERADVKTQQVTSNGKSTTTTTLFDGQVYKLNFHKDASATIQIFEKKFFEKFKNAFTNMKLIKFEDTEFNDKFSVYTNNDHQSYYVMTPHFIQRVKDLEYKTHDEISLIIIDSILYLSIYTRRDSFEPKMSDGINDAYLSKMKEDIDIIKSLVNDLNLKNTLYKKEA